MECCEQFDWLHYDIGLDAVVCYLCMKCNREKKFLASTKREQAFISRGFTYWKEATTAFEKHMSSDCHRKAVEALIVLPKCTKDIGELQNAQCAAEKAKNRKMFLLVLNNLRFLLDKVCHSEAMEKKQTAISSSSFIFTLKSVAT